MCAISTIRPHTVLTPRNPNWNEAFAKMKAKSVVARLIVCLPAAVFAADPAASQNKAKAAVPRIKKIAA